MTPKELAEKMDTIFKNIDNDDPKNKLTKDEFDSIVEALENANVPPEDRSPTFEDAAYTLGEIEEAMGIAYDEWNFESGTDRDLNMFNWLKGVSEDMRSKYKLKSCSPEMIHFSTSAGELIQKYLDKKKKNNDKEQEQTRDNQ